MCVCVCILFNCSSVDGYLLLPIFAIVLHVNSRTGKIVYGIKPQNSGSFCCGEDGNGLGRGMATWRADAVLP